MIINEFEQDLIDFKDLYAKRPIRDNSGGMKSPHLFALYRWLKSNKPELIIESGVWKGQGTWLFKQICPNAKIISIDINMSNLVFIDQSVLYYDKDIKTLDLKTIVSEYDPEKVLAFFDDHKNFSERIDFLIDANVKHVIIEDNYPIGQGDCISPKKILTAFSKNTGIDEKNQFLSVSEVKRIRRLILKYEEFRPIFVDSMTRWNVPWSYETLEPILDHSQSHIHSELFKERFDYTWMCHVEIGNE